MWAPVCMSVVGGGQATVVDSTIKEAKEKNCLSLWAVQQSRSIKVALADNPTQVRKGVKPWSTTKGRGRASSDTVWTRLASQAKGAAATRCRYQTWNNPARIIKEIVEWRCEFSCQYLPAGSQRTGYLNTRVHHKQEHNQKGDGAAGQLVAAISSEQSSSSYLEQALRWHLKQRERCYFNDRRT